MKLTLGILVGFALVVLFALVSAWAGWFSVAAAPHGGGLSGFLAYAAGRSIEVHAKDAKNPLAGQSQAVAAGLEHFRASCVLCHGAPDVKAAEFAGGLEPPAPDLSSAATQSMTDGELYWTVRHGIMMSGMPAFGTTHDEPQLWQMVTFIRQLPHLTAEQQDQLRSGAAVAHEHNREGNAAEHHPPPSGH